MDTFDTLFARRSISRLADPGPTDDELATMLSAAVAAPDHGEARPWRFVVFTGDDRLAFGKVLAASYTASAEAAGTAVDSERLDKEHRRFLRAPMVVAVLCRMQARRVVPAEQRDAVARRHPESPAGGDRTRLRQHLANWRRRHLAGGARRPGARARRRHRGIRLPGHRDPRMCAAPAPHRPVAVHRTVDPRWCRPRRQLAPSAPPQTAGVT